MGYWQLETEKVDADGNGVELNMDDLGHIAEAIQQGFTSGEVYDVEDDEQLPESISVDGSITVS